MFSLRVMLFLVSMEPGDSENGFTYIRPTDFTLNI